MKRNMLTMLRNIASLAGRRGVAEAGLVLAVSLGGTGCARAAPEPSYCDRLGEMRLMPMKSDDTVEDEVYNGLFNEGKKAVPCLLGKVTDPRPMRDPRKAPFYSRYAVGDAAVGVLLDICDMSLEDALPADVRAKWNERGIYAYFAFVEKGVENRRKIAEALAQQGCG